MADLLNVSNDPTDVFRQRDRTRALRRQSVMRSRRESAGGLESPHPHGDSEDHDRHSKSHPDDDDDDDDDDNEST